ncbi:hypothetical protein SHKM778_26210 [Streptomyces sp. KM77-8]|uniref:Uncharacterized protein n=1 Tax=Streptomyces haneummycinicus TaxID=3074435 RepID=A0AAT9HFG4_9ACTN
MPTSFSAVLVFLVVVVPGLAFELSLRRRSPSRVESPFVESARVVLVGALSTAAATALLIALREIRPGSLPSPTGLLADSARYATAHPELTATGLAAEVFAATALALLAVGLVRSPTSGGIQSFDDVWYELLYNDVPAGKRPKLVVALKSGGYRVSGFFHSMNTHPEVDRRELVLKSVELFREDQASGTGPGPPSMCDWRSPPARSPGSPCRTPPCHRSRHRPARVPRHRQAGGSGRAAGCAGSSGRPPPSYWSSRRRCCFSRAERTKRGFHTVGEAHEAELTLTDAKVEDLADGTERWTASVGLSGRQGRTTGRGTGENLGALVAGFRNKVSDTEDLGWALRPLLLPEGVEQALQQAYIDALRDDVPLRIRIRCANLVFSALPWELTRTTLALSASDPAGAGRDAHLVSDPDRLVVSRVLESAASPDCAPACVPWWSRRRTRSARRTGPAEHPGAGSTGREKRPARRCDG